MRYAISTDNGNGQPVKGAIITFSRNGSAFNIVSFPDNTGVLYFDSVNDADLFSSGVNIRVTAPGHNPAGTTGNAVSGDWVFTLRPNGLETAAIAGFAIAAAVALASGVGNKKKKLGRIDVKRDLLPWAVPAAIVIGGYLVYQKFFGATVEEKARDTALDTAIAQAGAPTLSDIEIAATANAIYEDIQYSWISNDLNDAVRQLCKVKNTADILLLIKSYGRRTLKTLGVPRGSFTLEESVASQLGTGDKDFINRYYDAQGIDFNF